MMTLLPWRPAAAGQQLEHLGALLLSLRTLLLQTSLAPALDDQLVDSMVDIGSQLAATVYLTANINTVESSSVIAKPPDHNANFMW